MKKIIMSLFALTFLLVGQSVFASNIWNNGSQGPECPDINIASGSNGWGSPCWTGTNINVQPGDTVSVKIYYHNASGTPGVTATNTRIKVVAPTGSSTNHSFSGQILSPQGNLSTSGVTANVSSAQTLTYSSTIWYVQNSNGTMVQNALLNGQSGSEVIGSSGLYIGNVIPGWTNSQGAVVVNFTVGSSAPTPSCSISTLTANGNSGSTSITSGSSATIAWSTNNCTSATIYPNIANVSNVQSGSQTLSNIISSTTYTMTAYGANYSQDTKTVTVNVTQAQTSCSISYFRASPSSIEDGDSSTLTWNTDGDCTSASINKGVGIVNASYGTRTVYPSSTTTYILTVSDNNGHSDTSTTTVYVDENQNYSDCSISYFRASPSSIEDGDSSKLTWDTNGDCSSASINRNVGSVNATGGSEYVYPTSTTTYTLTVRGVDGNTDTETVTVDVDENQNNNDCSVSYFTANPTTINYGGLSTLSWNTNDCTSVSISNIGSVNESGNQTIYPKSTTSYVLYAYGENGSPVSKTVRVNVNNYVAPPTPVYNTCAVTTVATNVGQNSATLNGLVTNSNGSANTYFEYGKTVNLGMQTSSRSISGSTSFSDLLTGLSSNTIYFYRLVSNCNNGTGRGSVEVFQTTGTQTITRTIVRQGTTVIGTSSPIMLKIENRYQSFRIGDSVDYTVTYKNIGSKKLTHPVLQVILPKGVAFLNSSQGTYSSDTYTLTVSLNDLNPGDEGVVYLQGRVDSIDTGNAQIVTTAILVYTSPSGAQENAIAYVLNNPIINSSGFGLGALALFGSMFGMGILGWLLLLILILLAILLFRKIYRKN